MGGGGKSKQTGEGSTEGVGGQTAASDQRGAGTPSSLASDCAVLDDTSPFISDKGKTRPLRHATCNGEKATGFPEHSPALARRGEAESFCNFSRCSGDLVSVEKSLKFHENPLYWE